MYKFIPECYRRLFYDILFYVRHRIDHVDPLTAENHIVAICINPLTPLSPHDASKHHFETLKNDLISYTYGF